MSNIEDGLQAYLSGKIKMEVWKREFLGSWFGPIIGMMKMMAVEGARHGPDVDQNKLMGMLSPEAQHVLRGE